MWKTFVCGAILALCLAGAATAQISPGPLSRAHHDLEGVTQCITCHDFRGGARALNCLGCHAEIRHRLAARAGFHFRAVKQGAGDKDCARCHAEHNGEKFVLIKLDRRSFDHLAETGFALEGKHRAQTCEACHNTKKQVANLRTEIKMKDPNHSFLGLKRECLSCHEDQHRGQLGTDCARCHNNDGWKTVRGFNHAETKFPLTGLHQPVACNKCHMPRGATTPQFKGIAFSGCQNCHNDPHKGAFQEAKFRGGCDSCHTTLGWKKATPSPSFNHAQTKFPLAGKHADAACQKCHKDPDFHRPIAHDKCADCHEDQHRGQFVARQAGSDCGACHNENGYKPALFDRQAHQQSAFRLEGKHASLECAKCHLPPGRDAVYKIGKLLCAECHSDPHGGEFAAAPMNNRCDQCHSQETFRPATFDTARHARTRFALTGKHLTTQCAACHKALPESQRQSPGAVFLAVSVAPQAKRQYHFESQTCQACHQDPHDTKITCETCHNTADWKKTAVFDHATTRFRLDGGHQRVECAKCHVPTPRAAVIAPRFASTNATCGGCHQKDEVHGGQFRQASRDEDCAACHAPSTWKVGSFSHENTRFPLDIAHRNVTCNKCHKEERTFDRKQVRIYRDTPVDCVKCH